MPFLLDETAAIGMFFGLLLKASGLIIGFFLFLRVGWKLFAENARTEWGKLGRFMLVLLVAVIVGFLLLLAIIHSL
jgi:hypothetical protein